VISLERIDYDLEYVNRKSIRKLIEVARSASDKAQRESSALGLSIEKIVDGIYVRVDPDGTVTEIRKIEKVKSNIPGIKKGTILCFKKEG
jgi:hypothetical protein